MAYKLHRRKGVSQFTQLRRQISQAYVRVARTHLPMDAVVTSRVSQGIKNRLEKFMTEQLKIVYHPLASDTLVECQECGAIVNALAIQKHTDWHAELITHIQTAKIS